MSVKEILKVFEKLEMIYAEDLYGKQASLLTLPA